MHERRSAGRYETWRSWSGRPRSDEARPKRLRARSLASASWPLPSTTTCAIGQASNASSRTRTCPARWLTASSLPARAISSSRSRRPPRETLAKIRRFRSIGTNVLLYARSVSALPRNRKPLSFSAKWNRSMIRPCVSVLKYISVLRQASRSIREIGASWIRSCRPKITERRRSFWNDEAVVARLEVLPEQVGGDRLDLLGAVGGEPGPAERPLVDVGGVDLDPVAERPDADRLGQDHRQRVRLLARGAAGAPEPDRPVGGLARDQAGDDLLGHRLPRPRVAEEGRHVDQDRVEEVRELVGVDLQVVDVVGVALHADHVHPLGDAAHQARPLVPREVEAAGAAEVLQQQLEVRFRLFRTAHGRCPTGPR